MESTGPITVEIIEKIRSEGTDGVDEFVRRYGPRLLVFVRYKLGAKLREKVDAEDVLQDFFTAIVENRHGFLDKVDDRGVHRAVFRMLENRIKDLYEHHFKTKKRDAHLEVRETARNDASSGFSLAQLKGASSSFRHRIEAQDEYKSLSRLVEGLDEDRQLLFVLKFVQELTNAEIAAELGCSVSTVKRNSADLIETIQRLRQR